MLNNVFKSMVNLLSHVISMYVWSVNLTSIMHEIIILKAV